MPGRVRIGDREVFLLSMLIDQKLYGYQIAQMLKDHASFFIEIDQSGVYNTLRKLEKQDWVTVELEKAGNAPVRKLYRITQSGTTRLESSLLENSDQTRLSILGTLNLLINAPWLPSEKLKEYLSARILKLEEIVNTASVDHDGAAEDPMTDYLNAVMQIEMKYAKKLLPRNK